jgi:hypothetical protein
VCKSFVHELAEQQDGLSAAPEHAPANAATLGAELDRLGILAANRERLLYEGVTYENAAELTSRELVELGLSGSQADIYLKRFVLLAHELDTIGLGMYRGLLLKQGVTCENAPHATAADLDMPEEACRRFVAHFTAKRKRGAGKRL